MIADPVFGGLLVFLLVFAGIAVAGSHLLHSLPSRRRDIARMRELAQAMAARAGRSAPQRNSWWTLLPRIGSLFPHHVTTGPNDLRTRLRHAGYFHPQTELCFTACQVLLAVAMGITVGLSIWWFDRTLLFRAVAGALAGCCGGYLLASYCLVAAGRARQRLLRKGIPDALDMLVLCLEGGLNLNAAIQFVTDELEMVHPDLRAELTIVHREMQLGLAPGQAMRKFADRCGLSDIRDLASVLLQSETLGAGVSKMLRSHADTARQERRQKAQETAQKAAVKILFPTLLFIFPAIFVVLVGPAAFQLTKLFAR